MKIIVLLFMLNLFAFPQSGFAADDKPGSADEIHYTDQSWQVPVTLGKDGWMLYKNARFGFVLPVPPGMQPAPPPTNGDGQMFTSEDGKIILTGSGGISVDDLSSIEARWSSALAEEGRTITYQRRTETWFVISGIEKDGTHFYTRHTAGTEYCAVWTISYPQTEEKKVVAWIERIAKEYEPRLE